MDVFYYENIVKNFIKFNSSKIFNSLEPFERQIYDEVFIIFDEQKKHIEP